jgi:outer membrane biosynthesis protein TonB
MSEARITFDQPVGTANTPAVSRRGRAWVSPDGQRSVVAGLLALITHVLVLWVAGLLPTGAGEGHASLRPEETPSTMTIPLEVIEEAAPAGDAPAAQRVPEPVSPEMAARIATIARVRLAIETTAAEVAARQHAAAPVDLSHLADVRGVVNAGMVAPGGMAARVGAGSNGGAPSGGVQGVAGGPGGGGQGTGRPSLAQPARPSGGQWRCPWPSEAMAADIYAQNVLVRVVVEADGSVVSASALSDPGHGFAAAAEACARRETYSPARDDAGTPVRATTPAIRVNFSR